MAKTIIGVFDNRQNAEDAIFQLEAAGFNPEDISIVMKDTTEGKNMAAETGAAVAGGAASGATTGAVLGGLAGLLASTVIPGLGAIFIGGPLAASLGLTGAAATAISGAATGAVAGGLIGALTGFGISMDEAKMYEEQINKGAILLAVPARNMESDDVEDLLRDNGATKVRSFPSEERRGRIHQTEEHSYQYGMKGGRSEAED